MAPGLLRYRGRDVGPEDVVFIRALIAQNPGLSRRRLSVELCGAWNWVQPNGTLRDMVCRGLLLALHRTGLIGLPAPRVTPPNNVVAHRRTARLTPIFGFSRWRTMEEVVAFEKASFDCRILHRDRDCGLWKPARRGNRDGATSNPESLLSRTLPA